MKRIFKIGTVQYFTYTIPKFMRKNIKKECWVVRNVRYIYANNEEEAKEKYKNWFFKEYEQITYGWGNWYLTSDDVDIFSMRESSINITFTEIVSVNDNINVNYNELKKDMQAEDFKEWWFDNKKSNYIPK